MLRQARERLPGQSFIEANIAHWAPPENTDVLFANRSSTGARLRQLQGAGALPQRVLAVQMPDSLDEPAHVLMREVAHLAWRNRLAEHARLRDALEPGVYYDALRPLCARLEIWHTIYNHVLDDATAIVEWVKGTLCGRSSIHRYAERKQYVAEYTKRIAEAYLPQADGKVLLRFPRIFIVAVK